MPDLKAGRVNKFTQTHKNLARTTPDIQGRTRIRDSRGIQHNWSKATVKGYFSIDGALHWPSDNLEGILGEGFQK